MKYLRHGPFGSEPPGLLADDGTIRDLSGIIADIDPSTIGELINLAVDLSTLPVVAPETRIGALCRSAREVRLHRT